MAQTVKLTLSTLLDILGWHGSFLLLLIISFKFLFERDELFFMDGNPGSCPCTWHVAFGTIMFLFPSLILYMIAIFGYFRQDNDSVPWKPIRKLYELKSACVNYDGRIAWNVHVEQCARCQQVRRNWSLVKIVLSAILSLLYPLVWLSLSFLETNYYVCAHAGPRGSTVKDYCDASDQWIDLEEYEKKYALAFIRSKIIGSVFFVATLFFLGLFLVLYGEIANHLRKIESSRGGPENAHPLQVHVAILPGGRSSEAVNAGRRPGETAKAVAQSADKNKSIHINLSDEFTTALRGCFQEGTSGQGIDVHCSQQHETWSRQGPYVVMRPESAGPLHQRVHADHTNDLAPLVQQETRDAN